MNKGSSGSRAKLGQGEGAHLQRGLFGAFPSDLPAQSTVPTALRSSCTHGCPRGGGREDGRRILIFPKLPMIYMPPKANLYSSLSRTTQIQSCILSLKSPRLTKSPRLPNGLISRVSGKAQREPRLLKANKKSLMEIFFPKENTLESFLGYSQFKVVKQVCPWG